MTEEMHKIEPADESRLPEEYQANIAYYRNFADFRGPNGETAKTQEGRWILPEDQVQMHQEVLEGLQAQGLARSVRIEPYSPDDASLTLKGQAQDESLVEVATRRIGEEVKAGQDFQTALHNEIPHVQLAAKVIQGI